MLLKLLKYDFRAMWKQFSLIWGAALALALVNRFGIFVDMDDHAVHLRDSFVSSLPMFAFMAVLIAMFVIGIIFVINRFSRGLLGDEGYLMFTLPVRSWQLVASKLICGVVTWVGCSAVSFLSALIMLPLRLSDLLRVPFWSDIFRGLMQHPGILALAAEFLLMALAAIVMFIATMYLAMAAGHLSPRHKRLVSIAAFIGLYILLINLYSRVFSYRLVQSLMDTATSNAHGAMLTASAVMLLPAAAFLAVTCWILEHKLNLE